MKTKYIYVTIFIVLLLSACRGHDRKTVLLLGFGGQKEVIYQTPEAEFCMGYDDLIAYCKNEDDGEPNDFVYKQIIDYISSYSEVPILIPDTLGTKIVDASEIVSFEKDGDVRIRDQEHPYAHITDRLRWTIIDFAKQGKLKIFVKSLNGFADTVIVDELNTDYNGVTNIDLPDGSTIFSQLRWIK